MAHNNSQHQTFGAAEVLEQLNLVSRREMDYESDEEHPCGHDVDATLQGWLPTDSDTEADSEADMTWLFPGSVPLFILCLCWTKFIGL